VYSTNHCNPTAIVAISKQAQTLIHCSSLYYVLGQAKLAAKMLEISDIGKIFIDNLDAEVLIWLVTKKPRWLCLNLFRRRDQRYYSI
jgi:hypothetical protein